MNKEYDLIAIGGGSGGLAVAERAAAAGKRVAIIEGRKLGGTCVNNGCVPKKIMWYAANLAHAVDDASAFGIPAQRGKTDWRQLVETRERYIQQITDYWGDYVQATGIERIQGIARFLSPHTLDVNGQVYTARHIVIATGGQPIIPAVPGAELGISSDGFFELTELPERVAVIGGGYIGVELAGVLSALGARVTLVALEQRLLERFDPMLGDNLEKEMQKQGIRIQTGFKVTGLSSSAEGILVHGDDESCLAAFDSVIWAVGRRANTTCLDLHRAGVKANDNGIIPVDEYENTNVSGIYALGDVTGKPALTPVAIAAGRKLADRLCHNRPHSKLDYDLIPSVVFSHPPVATLGLTEQAAREQFARVTVYKSEFTPMRHALSAHGAKTAMKLICRGDQERIVGLHLIGEQADEILQGFAVAVKMGACKADFDNTMAIHPTSAEELVTMKVPVAVHNRTDAHDIDNGLEWQAAS